MLGFLAPRWVRIPGGSVIPVVKLAALANHRLFSCHASGVRKSGLTADEMQVQYPSMLTLKPFRVSALILGLCALAGGQSTTGRQFEVASIRQLDMTLADVIRTGHSSVTVDDAIADLKGQSPILLITRAFGVLEDQVINLPESSRGIFFDIQAKLPAGATKDQFPEMLQSLLATRFKLVVHRQEDIREVYELQTGSNAAKLKRSEGAGPGRCAMESGHRICHAMTMAELAATINNIAQLAKTVAARTALSNPGISSVAADATAAWLVDRPIVDKTGSDGRFDFPFDYGPPTPGAPPVRIVDSLNALGLKLEQGKRVYQNVVIDHIDRLPTAN